MTVLKRAATVAAMALALTGMISSSAPGLAAEPLGPVTTAASLLDAAQNDPNALPVPHTAQLIDEIIAAPASEPLTPAPEPAAPALAVQSATFDTLADAVAAQDVAAPARDEAVRCLAGAVYFESKGEPLAGQLAVAQVILNRARSGRFAADVCGVVKQPGQFSFVRGGAIPAVDEGRAAWRTAVGVAKVALAEAWAAPAPAALFFRARAAGVAGRMVRVASIGNHVFFR